MADQVADRGDQVRRLFDAKAATWPAKYAPGGRLTGRLAQFTDALASHAPAGGRVLDLGCGTGDLARAANRAGLRATACDISAGMLSRAAAGDAEDAVEWVQLDPLWRRLPFESGTFDVVVAASVLEYVDRPGIILRECARVLRPGGIVLCTVPDPVHPLRWLEWVAGLAARLPLARAAGDRWPWLDRYLTYLKLSRQRQPAGWWSAIAALAGLLTVPGQTDAAEHSLRLLMFKRPGDRSDGTWPPLQRASPGEDARVERNGPEPEAGCQLPHADASSKEREMPKGRPMRERTRDQSGSDLDRHENSACRKTAVLILNWNNATATLDCLACLQPGTSELQAVAIDNGSSDGSADLITRVHPDVPIVRLPNNEGFARGTNAGLRWVLARGEYDVVAFLNNDAQISADDLLRAVDMIRKDHSIGLLTGKILRPDGRLWYGGGRLRRWRGGVDIFGARRRDRGQCDLAADVTFISLAFAVTRRDVIEHVGLLADEYFFGQEEWDYSLRVRKSGYRLRYEPSIGCIHGGDGSHNNSSPEFVYNGYRNKLMFQQRYLPRWAFPVWRMAFVLYARTILPPTCVWIRGTKLPPSLLRFCALEALRDHAPGRRIEEADLLDFRQRAKAFGARAMTASARLP